MISVDCLSCLDGLIWLRTQEQVARKMQLAQSSVSRNVRRCCEVFNVKLLKVGLEYHLVGDLTLINMQRDVHQYYKWNAGQALRMDGQGRVHASLHGVDAPAWVCGNLDYGNLEHPLRLMRRGLVDVWITPPGEEFPDALAHELVSVPLLPEGRGEHLVVRRRYRDHPRFLGLRESLGRALRDALENPGGLGRAG